MGAVRTLARYAEDGTCTRYVQYVGPWGQAALRLRYVPHGGPGAWALGGQG